MAATVDDRSSLAAAERTLSNFLGEALPFLCATGLPGLLCRCCCSSASALRRSALTSALKLDPPYRRVNAGFCTGHKNSTPSLRGQPSHAIQSFSIGGGRCSRESARYAAHDVLLCRWPPADARTQIESLVKSEGGGLRRAPVSAGGCAALLDCAPTAGASRTGNCCHPSTGCTRAHQYNDIGD
jgi:hypothetical protein